MRYTAQFDAQAWFRDNAMSVDPEGDTVWDCTDYFLSNAYTDADRAEMLADIRGSELLDSLRDDPAAPQWVKDWSGPFEVEIIESA